MPAAAYSTPVLMALSDPSLPGLEAESITKLQKEVLEVIEQGAFEIGFKIPGLLGKSGEFKHIWVAD